MKIQKKKWGGGGGGEGSDWGGQGGCEQRIEVSVVVQPSFCRTWLKTFIMM